MPGSNHDAMLAIVAKAVQQPPERIAVGLPYVDPEGRLNVADIYNQVAFWQSQGQVDKTVEAKAIIDLSFVRGHFNLPR
jgi:NitT/TauT family transport system substrate-binding protein